MRLSGADAVNAERAQALRAEQAVENMREKLPLLAKRYVKRALEYDEERDLSLRVGLGFRLLNGWRFGTITRTVRGKPTQVGLYVDDEGSLYQLFWVKGRLPFAGSHRVRRRIHPLWCRSELVRACHAALNR